LASNIGGTKRHFSRYNIYSKKGTKGSKGHANKGEYKEAQERIEIREEKMKELPKSYNKMLIGFGAFSVVGIVAGSILLNGKDNFMKSL